VTPGRPRISRGVGGQKPFRRDPQGIQQGVVADAVLAQPARPAAAEGRSPWLDLVSLGLRIGRPDRLPSAASLACW
jgi:hypothetical protein